MIFNLKAAALSLYITSFFSGLASGHAAPYHPSMYGFNVVAETFGAKGDFRPHTPLDHEDFKWWWMHGHIDYPPKDGVYLELPAGGSFMVEIACHRGATAYWQESEGRTDLRTDGTPCPGSPSAQWHAVDVNDVTGCAFAIVDKANVHDIQPEDFAIFTVNHRCVWDRETHFQVPAAMPECTNGYCHCAWFWIHSSNSGSQQMYMNAYKCKVTGSNPAIAKKIGKPQVARRCGADPAHGKPDPVPSNCTVGPKQPLYWYQNERNNMFEGTYGPPLYNLLYDFKNGAQNDIFVDEPGYVGSPSLSLPSTTATPPIDIVTSTSTVFLLPTQSSTPVAGDRVASSESGSPSTTSKTSTSSLASQSSLRPSATAEQQNLPTSTTESKLAPAKLKHCKRVGSRPKAKRALRKISRHGHHHKRAIGHAL